ncbi:hypothetical protein CDCA_CDCA17G4422 [Cyanidium caldarium]|uniref:Origin recognition complex subunit 2 n=1 Tax=Cyanidium caldarium TaxID=2771 RepID=A0AAV9J1A6_CYACA|nr:hypothetical protein CDCA_CDCA17G4422 [Cyanidium caldarium]
MRKACRSETSNFKSPRSPASSRLGSDVSDADTSTAESDTEASAFGQGTDVLGPLNGPPLTYFEAYRTRAPPAAPSAPACRTTAPPASAPTPLPGNPGDGRTQALPSTPLTLSLDDALSPSASTSDGHRHLVEEALRRFPLWKHLLHSGGFSVLAYGFGSKRAILEAFAARLQQDIRRARDRDVPGADRTALVVADGYNPMLSVRLLLQHVLHQSGLSDAEDRYAGGALAQADWGSGKSVADMLVKVGALLAAAPCSRLYLVLHSIDGAALRTVEAQEALSRLASLPQVHLVASVDHVNTPLLWPADTTLARFRWAWQDCTTFAPYDAEGTFMAEQLGDQSEGRRVRGAVMLLRGLTGNAQKIFQLLAEHQLRQLQCHRDARPLEADEADDVDTADTAATVGLSFDTLYRRCRQAFLVSNPNSLRAVLTELRDHELLVSLSGGGHRQGKRPVVKSRERRVGTDGAAWEWLRIPLEAPPLQRILDECASMKTT